MNITVICVGKIKEKYLKSAIDEYTKRLTRYCKLSVVELGDEKTPDNASEKENVLIRKKEGDIILSKIKDNMFVIALELKGKMLSSIELSGFIKDLGIRGESNVAFIIGGSLGLSEAVLERSNYKLCFSKLTFPHQLFRVILLEQVYRSFRIISGEPYHK
ncbi:23S rRNA (pseudouridine(1915)-N(3))-methyltransferase RlmH [Clostridium psychrophilum]|uniref:23S rRNA (pseudouridine(1915)-N(3))-methyltransferase RlmH n=1 Tax=Clostridium psychrophilum TaxID=132926 RepID=UPI001C0B2B66|nr:23S rRNA (pseudouridine(1915)-N(3))-methyltransferase RlmH [Clostridium psychrophilum]MBU3181389.1 23S rRNA (pseudouridine(1915)-N(3))-methyltransferase RlmH [Clostridium psychrophilum]